MIQIRGRMLVYILFKYRVVRVCLLFVVVFMVGGVLFLVAKLVLMI